MSSDHARTDPKVDTETRRRRLRYRAWHRGTREMDLVMGRFADAELATLPEAELDDFERLIDAQDRDIYDWVIGRAETPPEFRTAMFDRMKALRHRQD